MRIVSSDFGSGTAAAESLAVIAPPNNLIKFAALPCSMPPFSPTNCTEDAAMGSLQHTQLWSLIWIKSSRLYVEDSKFC